MKIKALILTACLLLAGCGQTEEAPVEEFEPTPLIIANELDDITGYYEGTISLSGEGTEPECYEGAFRIDIDGRKARITASDLIRSNFDELF